MGTGIRGRGTSRAGIEDGAALRLQTLHQPAEALETAQTLGPRRHPRRLARFPHQLRSHLEVFGERRRTGHRLRIKRSF